MAKREELERKARVRRWVNSKDTSPICWYGNCDEPNIVGHTCYCAGHELLYRAAHGGQSSADVDNLKILTDWESSRGGSQC